MLTNFEEITQELNDYELTLVPVLCKSFAKRTINNPIKAPEIIKGMKLYGYKITEPRLRKICNYIRSTALLPLIATHRGYYTSYDTNEIQKQINSLRERARSINHCADGLKTFLT